MTTTAQAKKDFKITYTSSAAPDMNLFHQYFDEGLQWARAQMGKTYPLFIGGKEVVPALKPKAVHSPINSDWVIGHFAMAEVSHVSQALDAAQKAKKSWERLGWVERVKLMRKASSLIRERKWELGAAMSLEVGKSRMESMGEVEESADLIDYYSKIMEENNGYVKPMGPSYKETTSSVLRPYGVFTCISPFNFPMALATGMSSAALIAGNVIVFKPSPETPWTGYLLNEIYQQAGLPAGVFNFITGDDAVIGDPLWKDDRVDGLAFTGSKEVGMRMIKEFSGKFWKPALAELGGKNAAIVCASADLDAAAEGIMRSAFGLQGQKCSACSRIYVEKSVAEKFTQKLIEKTNKIVMGDPTQMNVFLGPVINARAVKRYEEAVRSTQNGGHILVGGSIVKGGIFAKGHFVSPTIARLPLDHELFLRELFLPFTAIAEVASLEEAVKEANKVEYGLTAGIFSSKKEEVEYFFDQVEAGVCYANRKGGATTGAWPGVQSFGGWKGSGTTGKGGCGPYYVAQFMHEQSRTIAD